jgi:hypothetical protein
MERLGMRWQVWVAGDLRGERETFGAATSLRDHYVRQVYDVEKVTEGVLHETDWEIRDSRGTDPGVALPTCRGTYQDERGCS